jgi:hypothetical protein
MHEVYSNSCIKPRRLQISRRGPFAKSVNSIYYSESELCEGAVTVSFSTHLPWQAMHFTTLHALLENVLQTVDHLEISCLRPPFSWLEKPKNRMGQDLNLILRSAWKKWVGGTPLEHPPYSAVCCDTVWHRHRGGQLRHRHSCFNVFRFFFQF